MATAVATFTDAKNELPLKQLSKEVAKYMGPHGFFEQVQYHISQYPSDSRTEYEMTIEDLDGLVDGGAVSDELYDTQFDYEWEALMLSRIAWWHYWAIPDDNMTECEGLLVEIKWLELRAAFGAHMGAPFKQHDTAIELVRCYRIWTRATCAAVQKTWPAVDWSGLEMMV